MRFRYPIHAVLLLFAIWALSAPAWALTDAEVDDRVQQQILDRHPTDTPKWWHDLGSNAPKVIIARYGKTSHPFQRMRLLQGLSAFPEDSEAADFIKRQAADSTNDDVIRNAAIHDVARSQGAKELAFVEEFLKSPDPDTRLAAGESLQLMNDPRADAALQAYLAEEKAPWVVEKLRKPLAVSRMRGPHTGVQPAPSASPVAPEDALSAYFVGAWSGYWVAPKTEAKTGMRSEPARVKLESAGPYALKGELALKAKGKGVRVLRLSQAGGKKTHFSGAMTEPAKAGVAPPEIAFDAELVERAGVQVIELRVPSQGAILVLRKD